MTTPNPAPSDVFPVNRRFRLMWTPELVATPEAAEGPAPQATP